MYNDDYEPQHPMLKQMREEQALMDNIPEPMRISSEVFEISEASKCKKGGIMGFGAKIDPNGVATKAFKAFYKKFGVRQPKDAAEAKAWNKAYNALQKKYPACKNITPADLKKAGIDIFG